MTDRVLYRTGGWAAAAAAVLSFLYTLDLVVRAAGVGPKRMPAQALALRSGSQVGPWLLAALGIVLTLAVVAVAARAARRHPHARGWAAWAGGIGLAGAVMTAAHGVYDALRLPVLAEQWATEVEARRLAIVTFAGVPAAVDPRGLGSLLLMALFALVAAKLLAPRDRWVAWSGLAFAAAAGLAFVVGLFAAWSPWRAVLAGLALGVLGPLWWLGVARELLADGGD